MSSTQWSLPYTVPYSDGYADFMVFFSILASVSPFFQAYTIFKDRSSGSVSLLTWSVALISNIAWLYYGLMIQDLSVTLSSILPVLGSILVLCLLYHYKEKKARPLLQPIKKKKDKKNTTATTATAVATAATANKTKSSPVYLQ
jgi:uncharacterized protein with PQ loop repeat